MSNNLLVPHRKQLFDGYCLPACAQMVLAYWGILRSQEKIAWRLRTVPKAGTPGFHLLKLTSHDLEIIYRSGDLSDLLDALSRGIPPIVLVNTGQLAYWHEEAAHAIVVVGIDSSKVFVIDPAMQPEVITVSIGEFELAWDEMVNRYGLIVYKSR